MPSFERVIIFGASVRAAAFSALRAGLSPWCADLFADADLRRRCPVLPVPADEYPDAFRAAAARGPEGPWMYTGGLENRPALVGALARSRPLWGNGAEVLRRVRSPGMVAASLRRAGFPCPEVRHRAEEVPAGRWLVKPLDGAGGRGIAVFRPGTRRRHVYYQE